MTFLAWVGAAVIALPVIFILSLAGTIWTTWWLYPAWDWFIVPLGVKPVSFWHFTALSFLFRTMTAQTDYHVDDRKTDYTKSAFMLLAPIIAWALLRFMR